MGDREFLCWIHARLEFRYGEDPSQDYMHKLRSIIIAISKGQVTPNTAGFNSMSELERHFARAKQREVSNADDKIVD